MFLGFLDEGQAGTLLMQLRNSLNAPVEPDSAPAWRIYGVNGLVAAGSGSASSFEAGTITAASNATPVVITSANHGVSTGQAVTVGGVGGNTGANGTFLATAINANTFSLQGSVGNGAYTSGGTWRTTGLYKVALSGSILSSLEAGKTYTLVLTYLVSGAKVTMKGTFTVR